MRKPTILSVCASISLLTIQDSSTFAADPATSDDIAQNKAAVAAPSNVLEPESIAAIINGEAIKVRDIDEVMRTKPAFAMYQTMNNKSPEMLNRLRLSVLNNMIDRRLLLAAAHESGAVTEEDLKKKVSETVDRYGGEVKLKEILKTSGMTYEQFMGDLRDDFSINSYLEKSMDKNVSASEEEMRKVYESNPQRFAQREEARARHILIKFEKSDPAEKKEAARKKIDELYGKVTTANASFADIAKENSECPSASRGGDLGVFPRGAMVPPFEQAAFALNPGEISKPIETDFGYHIIKLEEKHAASEPSFEKAKPKIQNEILHRKKAEMLDVRVKELRKKAKVEIKMDA